MSNPRVDEYQVGWVCALPKELTAATAMLDEVYDDVESPAARDNNYYVLGRIHGHKVAITCLPAGMYGTNAAATVATNMLRTFPGIRFGLLVGIGGGIPNLSKGWDVRLGDVVVSQPQGTYSGVVQYDLKKNLGDGLSQRQGFLKPPPTILLNALSLLQSQHQSRGSKIGSIVTEAIGQCPLLAQEGFTYPGSRKDLLYCSNAQEHQGAGSCTQCQNGVIQRKQRGDQTPQVHYGVIVSGNELMKNAVERDRLGQEFGAKCIEMEAAGLMNDFPCLVIRGICDYADAYKNDDWQEYAAATAAAFAKELLSVVKSTEVAGVKHATGPIKYNLGLNLFDAPRLDDELFVGRHRELQTIESSFQLGSGSPTSKTMVIVLGGMGGIGKTQLAINHAMRHRSSYSSIFWLNADTEATLKTSLRAVANRIFPPNMVVNWEHDELWINVSNWLSEAGNNRWLMVFDNYDDPELYPITKYYPSAMHGSIIITSRQPHQVSGKRIKVQSMAKVEESLRILASRSERDNTASDPGAHALVARLDGHPLALATAGAFLGQSAVSFTRYLALYNESWKGTKSTRALPDYPSRTLFTTWNLSFRHIEAQNPKAANLLRLFAYFDYRDIWYELLQGGKGDNQPVWFNELVRDQSGFEDALQMLTRFCLVEPHHETESYSLHVCIHDWVLRALNTPIDDLNYWLAFDCVASHIILEDDREELSTLRFRRFVPHTLRLMHEDFKNLKLQAERPRVNEMIALADLLRMHAQYIHAQRVYERILKASERVLGPDHQFTLGTAHNLGLVFSHRGKLVDAEQMYKRALMGYEKELGHNHELALQTIHSLGGLYTDQGKLAEAEEMYNRALIGCNNWLGANHRTTIQLMSNLAVLYSKMGRLSQAEKLCESALTAKEKLLGPDHESTLTTVNNLGTVYSQQGKMVEAKHMYERALIGSEKVLGSDHQLTLQTVYNLGLVHIVQGKLLEAEQLCRRALTGYEKAPKTEDTKLLDILRNLGLIYRDTGKIEDAKKMLQREVVGRKKVLGENHPESLEAVTLLNNLSSDAEAVGSE